MAAAAATMDLPRALLRASMVADMEVLEGDTEVREVDMGLLRVLLQANTEVREVLAAMDPHRDPLLGKGATMDLLKVLLEARGAAEEDMDTPEWAIRRPQDNTDSPDRPDRTEITTCLLRATRHLEAPRATISSTPTVRVRRRRY